VPEHEPAVASQETLWQTIKGDFAQAAGLKLIAVVLLLAWMAFQWGFGNDVLLPSIVASAFDGVDDGETWRAGGAAVAAATLAGFGFWAITQALDAVIMLTGLRLVPGITQRVSAFLQRKGWVTPYRDMKWSTRWIIAYATGVSALCLVDAFATGEHGVRSRRGIIATATALSAGSVALVVLLVSGAAMIGKRIPATEGAAETLIRYAKNPLTWIVIFGGVFLFDYLRGKKAS